MRVAAAAAFLAAGAVAGAARAAARARAGQPEAGLQAWDDVWRKESAKLMRAWKNAAVNKVMELEPEPEEEEPEGNFGETGGALPPSIYMLNFEAKP